MLWVPLDGAGLGGATLLVVMAYLPPQQQLAGGVVRRADGGLGGGAGRGGGAFLWGTSMPTRTAEDWPPDQPDLRRQHSADRARVVARGRALLEFCQSFARRWGLHPQRQGTRWRAWCVDQQRD